jgi:hypothetical protein
VPPKILIDGLGDLYKQIVDLELSPVLAGGLAVSYWGHPRSTQDIDLAILTSKDVDFAGRLRNIGLRPAKDGRLIDLGFIQVSQWSFAIQEFYMELKVDFLISNYPYHRQAIERAQVCDFPGIEGKLRVLSCEDLLIFKSCFGRLIDLADIRTLAHIHQHSLNRTYLNETARELGIEPDFWLK